MRADLMSWIRVVVLNGCERFVDVDTGWPLDVMTWELFDMRWGDMGDWG